MNEHMKELLKEMLIDNLEVKFEKEHDERGTTLVVKLVLFGESISSDSTSLNVG